MALANNRPWTFWLRKLTKSALWSILIWAIGQPAWAGVHFSLQGSFNDDNLGLRSEGSRSTSASVAFDLGTHFRIGLTHRQAMKESVGYVADEASQSYKHVMESSLIHANSIDFTIILYYGEVLVPYLLVGLVKKQFILSAQENSEPVVTKTGSIPPVPYGGLGMGIRLNQNFSLKLTYSVSPGIKQIDPALEAETAWDSVTSVGISYDI